MLGTAFPPYTWLIGLLIQPLLIAGVINHGIVEEHDLPAELLTGETATATWSLETGSSGGFARFQVQFPAGIIAESIENAGASFTFENGRGKFIWVETDPDETIYLKMRLTATSEFQGGTVTQWFSYIARGTRKDIEFEPHHISLRTATDEAAPNFNDTTELTVTRSWQSEGPDVGQMTLSISGHEEGQFLKVEETIGAQCSAEPLADANASLRDVYEQSILYVWQQAPPSDFEVSYRMMGNVGSCRNSVIGKVYTVIGGSVKEIQIPDLKAPHEPASEMTSEETPANDSKNTTVTEATVAAPTSEATEPVQDPEATSSSIAKIETESTEQLKSIRFKVQVLASHQRVDASHFAQRYNFTNALMIEEHEEWIKYITGSFAQYKSARDARIEIRANHDLPGPFVTAYRGNRRITVQEALLTTKQNWIP